MRGITLIEMLVALVLAGIAIAGALSGLANAQRAWTHAGVQGRLHERAQYVFATLEPELQMAGYFGVGNTPALDAEASAPAGVGSCGADIVLPLRPAVLVRTGSWPLACPAQGGGVASGTQVLVVKRASVVAGSVSPGAIALASDPLLADAEPRELRVRIYYVANSANGDAGTPALRVKSLTAVAGTPAFIDTEVMPGVEDLQIELLPSPADARTARVRLRILADGEDLPRRADAPTLELTRTFALRNAQGG